MIRMTCTCGRSRELAAMFAGRTVKCPDCGAMLAVPAAQPSAPGPAETVAPIHAPSAVEKMTEARFVAALTPTRALGRHLPFTSLSGIGLLVAFFCLPWLRLSCGAMIVAEPTGYNLAVNSEDSDTRERRKVAESAPGGAWDAKSASLIGAEEYDPKNPWGSRTPELWVFPGLGLALVLWGLYRSLVPSFGVARETLVALVLVMGAGGLLAYERVQRYRKKPLQTVEAELKRELQKLNEAMPQPPMSSRVDSAESEKWALDLVEVKNQPGFWLTVVSLAGAAAAMLGRLLFQRSVEP